MFIFFLWVVLALLSESSIQFKSQHTTCSSGSCFHSFACYLGPWTHKCTSECQGAEIENYFHSIDYQLRSGNLLIASWRPQQLKALAVRVSDNYRADNWIYWPKLHSFTIFNWTTFTRFFKRKCVHLLDQCKNINTFSFIQFNFELFRWYLSVASWTASHGRQIIDFPNNSAIRVDSSMERSLNNPQVWANQTSALVTWNVSTVNRLTNGAEWLANELHQSSMRTEGGPLTSWYLLA